MQPAKNDKIWDRVRHTQGGVSVDWITKHQAGSCCSAVERPGVGVTVTPNSLSFLSLHSIECLDLILTTGHELFPAEILLNW